MPGESVTPRAALLLASSIVLFSFAACSPKGNSGPAATDGSREQAARTASGDACHGDLTNTDVSPLLGSTQVGVQTRASDPQSCSFNGANGTVLEVQLARGGDVQSDWDFTQRANNGAMIAVADVGESALRNHDASGLMARKGNIFCHIEVIGIDNVLQQPGVRDADGLTTQLGNLCNKIFSAEHA